ncbi:MAG TPA: response regulator [Candidatus Acidoferrales bacterium]|nr:response regulator [Candidatus Acidoferrales bacterium]
MISTTNNPRIALVVDDSMLIRHTVCRFFEEHGFAVESATNGLEALEVLRTVHPDIIITDVSMPKMDGPELIRTIKRNEQFKCTPIIVLAARRSAGDILLQDVQPNHIIYKDIDIQEQLERMLYSTFTAD